MMMPLCCDFCKRLYDFHLGEYDKVIAHCEAYPDGIPEAVVYAGHFYPKPDDNGLQFDGVNVPDYIKRSKEEEDKSYEELKKYYDEFDMSDEEWLKTRREKEPELARFPDELLLPFRPRREKQPKIW